MTLHRFIPEGTKYGDKTACGIKLSDRTLAGTSQIGRYVIAEDGRAIYVTDKGVQFDCKRCRRVLEIRHQDVPQL